MSNRSVEVTLKLRTDQYKAEAESAKRSTEGLDRSVKDTDENLKKIPPDAAKAAAAMKLLGGEGQRTALKLDDLGKSTTSLQMLDQRLEAARAEVRKLGDEFNRTGNSTALTGLFKADDQVKELEKFRATLVRTLSDAGMQGGQEMAKQLSASLQGATSTPVLGPVLTALIIGAVAAALPAVNALLTSAVGFGGIGLGIVGQIHNPAVHGAFVDMGHDVMTQLEYATRGFAGPLVGASHILGDALKGSLGSIDFGRLAAAVEPLAHGVAGLVSAMGPGLNKLLAAAQPILLDIARMLPGIGRAISDMFASFADGGKGAREALRILVMDLEGLLRFIGMLVDFFSNLFSWIISAQSAVVGFLEHFRAALGPAAFLLDKMAAVLGDVRNGFGDATGPGNDFSTVLASTSISANGVVTAMRDLNTQLGDYIDLASQAANINLATSVIGVTDAIHGMTESLKANGTSFDINTVKGAANTQAYLRGVDAAKAHAEAVFKSTGSAQLAAQAYQADIDKLDAATIAAGGAKAAVKALDTQFSQADKFYDFYIRTHFQTEGTPAQSYYHGNRWGGVYTHAAEGALRQANTYSAVSPARYAFAEPATGGEAFIPRFGDAGRSSAILAQAAGWYGMDVVPRGARGGGGASTVVVRQPLNLVTPSGDVIWKTVIQFALDRGMSPADLWSTARR